MKEGPDIARIASLIGDPARANMLTALMSGKALTATELAMEAGITSQTASTHLSKLHDGGLVRPRKQGRHKYFALAGDEVARVLEGLMGLAAGAGHLRTRTGPKDPALRKARVCYNHLAGDMGVEMYDSMTARGLIARRDDDISLTDEGRRFVTGLGLDVEALNRGKTPLCLECLDWSERRSHLAGSLGRSLLTLFEDRKWAARDRETRVVAFTKRGEAQFRKLFPAAL